MGKSSLLNLLVPDAQAATREISEALQTGKHTTTDARLYALPDGWRASSTRRASRNSDSRTSRPARSSAASATCVRFSASAASSTASHLHEPDCAVIAARDRGDILPRRYDLFAKLTRESATFRDR